MTKFIGELLFAVIGALIRGLVYSLWLKAAAWLDPRVHGRTVRIVVALLMGLALFFLLPIVSGLFSY